jgi:hypothetical protein
MACLVNEVTGRTRCRAGSLPVPDVVCSLDTAWASITHWKSLQSRLNDEDQVSAAGRNRSTADGVHADRGARCTQMPLQRGASRSDGTGRRGARWVYFRWLEMLLQSSHSCGGRSAGCAAASISRAYCSCCATASHMQTTRPSAMRARSRPGSGETQCRLDVVSGHKPQ